MKALRLTYIIILTSLFSSNILAQTIDDFYPAMAFLWKKQPNNNVEYGTGFFITHKGSMLLITAQHVSNFLDGNSNGKQNIYLRSER